MRPIAPLFLIASIFAVDAVATCTCEDAGSKPCEQQTLASAAETQSVTFSLTSESDDGLLAGGLVVALFLWPFVWTVHTLRRRHNRLALLTIPRNASEERDELPLAA